MDEKTLKALVAAGAVKKVDIIATGARFHVEASTPNGSITAETGPNLGDGQKIFASKKAIWWGALTVKLQFSSDGGRNQAADEDVGA